MEDNKKYLDVMSDETREITGNAYELHELSRVFYAVGNNHIGSSLAFIADSLLKSCNEINNAVGLELNDRLKESQLTTSNVIGLVLNDALNKCKS